MKGRRMNLANGSRLCIALDLPSSVPYEDAPDFLKTVISRTSHVTGVYKINPAFFLRLMGGGAHLMRHSIKLAHDAGVPVIFDAKYGDVLHTNKVYSNFAYGWLEADAVTVNPYVGWDALAPFGDAKGKTMFVLCSTSNEGSFIYQDDMLGSKLYMSIAKDASYYDGYYRGHVGLVAGATHKDKLLEIANSDTGIPILIPGLGAQGGEFTDVPSGIYVFGRDIMTIGARKGIKKWGSKVEAKAKELAEKVST